MNPKHCRFAVCCQARLCSMSSVGVLAGYREPRDGMDLRIFGSPSGCCRALQNKRERERKKQRPQRKSDVWISVCLSAWRTSVIRSSCHGVAPTTGALRRLICVFVWPLHIGSIIFLCIQETASGWHTVCVPSKTLRDDRSLTAMPVGERGVPIQAGLFPDWDERQQVL
ncbi:hypothetical protein MAPG_09943 [Magnaporthiopsis poae ATCC 64411]|uniref:Uncharacterized protein n=1 Tax=Magnaporthiopsis poae (strain ATCC 64411 / 73-15) TaxID=644358 RepID=A0A0C4EB96_MAGP6|nr:hypothetical protein MAPG_09943 [Magnaporthiopsis poae ATCC 64411]